MTNLPLLTRKEVESHNTKSSCYVTVDNLKVYDVSSFLEEHPGGGDLIVDFAGKDVTEIMGDLVSHEHSEAAYEMLDELYLVGILATPEQEAKLLTRENRHDFKLEKNAEDELTVTTDFTRDYKTNQFLDLNKPLLMQVLRAKWTKEFYLEQVHKPRHYGNGSAPIFGNILEPLSKTPWFVVPCLWIPVDLYCIYLSAQGLPFYCIIPMFAFGLFVWTFIEYGLHRFAFHLDDHLPRYQLAYALHFLLHGVHHYLPMDKMRLVLPPTLGVILITPFYFLAFALFPYYWAYAGFAGAFLGYIMYDCTHYFLHHMNLPPYFKALKKYHLDHHYKNYELGFGVTSSFWDKVFNTELVETSVKSKGL
ncbi:hypothetical protein LXG23DRAFT_35421 [Yarrowia lipolytica]|uniref:Ceramide very long chain fatty acid hydroxylase n=1 Tax=Yarrowia lipolytica TaxID=4952 RepID=A0A1D8NN58_YARLL|nr:hypothetical protein YALI1_F17082g [Yarrowia lipolytica]KAB8280400.1 hypothetical protein BKA91DRAFT_44799 [Yarrowia lipolytica]KAE8168930.1 hypothetical protein BKA90DRAFT_6962 [Yarrowia lipolytica]KAJ8055783.1 hypothetical protein LXG23DRAFT_35421 [Yarrowia lipolytica]QNQ01183.1 Ceramide very long chain fatty acid hydroxylase SCS7 [Yarrowia lipolytica]